MCPDAIAAKAASTGNEFVGASAPIRPFGFAALYRAYEQCRRGKRKARNTQAYEARLLDRLAASRDALESFAWRPSRTLAFITTQPKLREIHAADFSDRVVHHLLVSHLEPLYEQVFIHDSYANRKGKGTHAAVDRLQGFMRQVTKSGKRPAYAMQLDIANFFNSIDRRILFRLLQKRLAKAVRHGYRRDLASALQTHCRALLTADPTLNVRRRGRPELFERVPPHKRLGALGPGVGLPIGNLTSQFFANVYLNELDQFVKHTLKVRYYVRYVDDFVLLHEDPAQLEQWRDAIVAFLGERLRLRLRGDSVAADTSPADSVGEAIAAEAAPTKNREFVGGAVGGASAPMIDSEPIAAKAAPTRGVALAPIAPRAATPPPRSVSAGSDFLGYVTFPFHRLVRRRVVHNFLAHLDEFARRHVRAHAFRLPPAERDILRARIASYLGHFRHANTWNLWQAVLQRHPWLAELFDGVEQAILGEPLCPSWMPSSVTSLASQWRHFAQRHPGRVVLLQVGKHWLIANRDVGRMGAPVDGAVRKTFGRAPVGGALAPIFAGDAIAAKAAPTREGFVGGVVGGASAPMSVSQPHRVPMGIFPDGTDQTDTHGIGDDIARNMLQIFPIADGAVMETGLPNGPAGCVAAPVDGATAQGFAPLEQIGESRAGQLQQPVQMVWHQHEGQRAAQLGIITGAQFPDRQSGQVEVGEQGQTVLRHRGDEIAAPDFGDAANAQVAAMGLYCHGDNHARNTGFAGGVVGGASAPIFVGGAIAAEAAPTGARPQAFRTRADEFVGGSVGGALAPIFVGGAIAAEAAPTGARPQAFRTKGEKPTRPGFAASIEIPAKALPRLRRKLKAAGIAYIAVAETGHLKSGHKRRELVYSWAPPGAFPSFHPVER